MSGISPEECNRRVSEHQEALLDALRKCRDDGAYDGARYPLGKRRRPDPSISVLGDFFEMRRLVYDQSFELAKRAAIEQAAAAR